MFWKETSYPKMHFLRSRRTQKRSLQDSVFYIDSRFFLAQGFLQKKDVFLIAFLDRGFKGFHAETLFLSGMTVFFPLLSLKVKNRGKPKAL